MKFKSGTRRKVIDYEKSVSQWWEDNKIFEKSVKQRPIANSYVFYDGPPFITGVPHFGTLLSSIVKDVVPRYQTMKGRRVERRWGWDCHGLPAEVYTEKKLGIHDKRDIGTKISLEDYINACRNNMVQTGSLWEDTIKRIGRWVDFKGAYKTMDKDYMESIWWAFKQLYNKGKLYEGERVLLYCTRDATPLSKAEVTMDAGSYKEVTDPSAYVKFKLVNYSTYLLAWTTTPWTLPANAAIAVNKDYEYVEIKTEDGLNLILAKNCLERVMKNEKHEKIPYEIIKAIKGDKLVGLEYEPLLGKNRGKNAQKVWAADFVTDTEGTGIVHIAPAYGEDDFNLAQTNKIPVVHVVDENGFYSEGEWAGKNIWDTNKTVAKTLLERGIVWKIEYIKHTYPHCYRCGTRLMYRAHAGWFMNVASQKEEMLAQNSKNINWFPEHFKHGRFEKNIEQAPDWNLTRDRFWATPMPIWEGTDSEGNKHRIVIGSYKELKDLSGIELNDYHRPWVDRIEFDKGGVHYKRIDKVLDGWFESGSMPFAQYHYPFENVQKFEDNFPGDFISEYVGQVRAWFYYLHTISIGLFDQNAFKNVIVTGTIAGNDGRKMSKSYGNYTDPNVLMDTYGADSLRFLLLSSPLLNGEDFALHDKEVGDVYRKLNMIWNMYDFFTMYAEVDNWEFNGDLNDPTGDLDNPLDIWIVSRLHQVMKSIDENMTNYNIPEAVGQIIPFIDDASNWYVRRSRRRFWKSGDTKDKNNAYRTLHYVLTKLSMVMAPFTPFLSEELYKKMTGGLSVHLLDWPKGGKIDEQVITEMKEVRDYIKVGLSERAKNHLKVRQPLASVTVPTLGKSVDFESILKEELNVKEVKQGDFNLDLTITAELKEEGLAREIIRHIQSARKDAGLNIDDRIKLNLSTDDNELLRAINKFSKLIAQEVLAKSITNDNKYSYVTSIKVDEIALVISLEKYE